MQIHIRRINKNKLNCCFFNKTDKKKVKYIYLWLNYKKNTKLELEDFGLINWIGFKSLWLKRM